MANSGSRGDQIASALAAFSLASAIAGFLFVIPTWGFSTLAGPVGLLSGAAGLAAPRKRIAIAGFALNALLTLVMLDWMEIVDWLPGPTD